MLAKPSLLLVVEIGDGVIVSAFLDKKGDLVAFVRDPFPLRPMGDNPWYYEPFDVLYAVRSTINRLLQKKCVSPQAIAGIAIVGQANAFMAWNYKNGTPLSSAVKIGTPTLKAQYRSLLSHSDSKIIEDMTGRAITDQSAVLALLKCREIAQNSPEKSYAVYGPLESWIATSITQHWESSVDKTMASWSAYTDQNVEGWDSSLLDVLHFSPSEWPRIAHTTECFATVKGFEPLTDGIPLHCFIHRSQAELLGAQCLSFGDMLVRLGSKESEAILVGGHELSSAGFLPLQVLGYEDYRKGGARFISLPPVPFLSDVLTQSDVITDMLQNVLGSSSLMMVPYHSRDGVKSHVKGFGFYTDQKQILAGFFESTAYCLRRFLDDVQNNQGITLRRVVITGELTEWDDYNQFLSDITQMPLLFYGKDMLGVRGAGYLLGKQLNFFSNQQLIQLKRLIFRQYVPQVDPLSSFATYGQWLEFANATNAV